MKLLKKQLIFYKLKHLTTMKHLKTFAALCCVVAAFAACEPQNGPANGQNGNNGQPGNNDQNPSGDTNHDYIDLGLSVKWATCNVGATKPEEYGNYYAWGETETKSKYSEDTYKWSNDGCYTFTKYNTSSSYGTVDNKTVLDPEDDAARANWGGAWRMPTDAEWTELRTKCTWTWTDDYNGTGVKGRIVTSNINGNSIFLPAAGYRSDGDLYGAGIGSYWSSSLDGYYPFRAYYVQFYSDYVGWSAISRYCGQSVRPVLGE